ncbi:MAG TPA: polysaccharide biosynthesis C-terminal domain-containing protein, partial [Gemmatirosa sp.]
AVLPALAVAVVFHKYQAWCWTIVAVVIVRSVCAGAGFLSSVLYAVGRQRWLLLPCLGGAVVAVVTNAWLTPTRGLRGALVAHLATQAVVAGLTLVAYARAQAETPAIAIWRRGRGEPGDTAR